MPAARRQQPRPSGTSPRRKAATKPRRASAAASKPQRRPKAARSLKTYHAKRDFDETPEPTGSEHARRLRRARPLLCVQKHLASHLHYDLRLEHRGVLLSWAVPKGPSLNPRDRRLAMMVEDHPLDYGSFEGVIPSGYGAGIVMLWDRGTWRPEPGFEDVDAALKRGELKFRLDGVKLKGSWVLVKTRGGPGGDPSRSWLLIKHRDNWAGELDITTFAPNSVKSSGAFADILAADNPDIWDSHLPARGGAAGKMLRDVVRHAAELRVNRRRRPAAAAKEII